MPYAKIWCVFDRDSFSVGKFNGAIQLAERQCIEPIWSNECFEIWYLLHFEFRNTAIDRANLYRELGEPHRLNRQYDKADTSVFSQFKTE